MIVPQCRGCKFLREIKDGDELKRYCCTAYDVDFEIREIKECPNGVRL